MGVSVVAMDAWTSRSRGQLAATLAATGCADLTVIRAMLQVPREAFLSEELREEAYLERALPIGEGQRIASPSMVARTLQLLSLGPNDRLLEIGTGSGYAAAVASHVARKVYTVERNANLARAARCFLARSRYCNVCVWQGDGVEGYPDAEPFDAISVTFPDPSLIRPLLGQLKMGGRLVMAMDDPGVNDALLLVTRTPGGFVGDALSGICLRPPASVRPLASAAEQGTRDCRTCA